MLMITLRLIIALGLLLFFLRPSDGIQLSLALLDLLWRTQPNRTQSRQNRSNTKTY